MFMRTVQQNVFLILNSVSVTAVTDPELIRPSISVMTHSLDQKVVRKARKCAAEVAANAVNDIAALNQISKQSSICQDQPTAINYRGGIICEFWAHKKHGFPPSASPPLADHPCGSAPLMAWPRGGHSPGLDPGFHTQLLLSCFLQLSFLSSLGHLGVQQQL